MEKKKRKAARQFLREQFKYQQHAENVIVELLIAYPSLMESLKDAKKKGIDVIYIGGPTRTSKPLLEISDGAVIFHE